MKEIRVENRKARFNYFIEESILAAIELQGWEAKAIRAGKAQISDAYVTRLGTELFLVGSNITPLPTTASWVQVDPTRSRKLIMHRKELDRIAGLMQRDGWTAVPLEIIQVKGRFKINIGLAKGKKQHDKRATERERDEKRDTARANKGDYS